MTPDQWQQLAGAAVVLVAGLVQRKKQNTTLVDSHKELNHELAERLANEVAHIRDEVSTVKTVIGIHKEEMRVSTGKVAVLTHDVEKLQELIPDVQDVMQKVLNYFERKKAQASETPTVGEAVEAYTEKKESGT